MEKRSARILKILSRTAVFMLLFVMCACSFMKPNNVTTAQNTFNSTNGCFSCLFFRVTYNWVGKFTSDMYDFMCDYALAFLALGLFFWTLMHVLKLVSSLREPNIAQFWVEMFITWFKCCFIAVFIATKDRLLYVINGILEPIGTLIIGTGAEVLDMTWFSDAKDVFAGGFTPAPGFSAEVGLQLENLIYRLQIALNGGRVLGIRLLGNDFANDCLALVILVIFTLLSIFFPFYLIDGLIRLAFVFVMLPIFMVCWCFRVTATYATKAFSMFMGAFLQIMMGCVFVAIAVAVFEGFVQVRSLHFLIIPETQDTSKIIYAEAERMSMGMIAFLFLAVYIYELSKRINAFTSHFTGAPGRSIMAGAIERFKSVTRALAWSAVAAVGFVSGAAPIAHVAAEHAKEEGEDAAKGKGDD